jgi:LysR family glycine cleavage system transcriptional activator
LRQGNNRQLNLRCSPSFAVRWLTPRLKGFLDANPEWGVRVDATPEFSDFDTEVMDLDLRYGSGAWERLHTECIINDFVLPMCSPEYRDRAACSQRRSCSPIFAGTAYPFREDALPMGCLACGSRHRSAHRAGPRCSFDRSSMAIQLARDGAGIVLDSVTLAQEDLERGTLVPLSTAFDVRGIPCLLGRLPYPSYQSTYRSIVHGLDTCGKARISTSLPAHFSRSSDAGFASRVKKSPAFAKAIHYTRV